MRLLGFLEMLTLPSGQLGKFVACLDEEQCSGRAVFAQSPSRSEVHAAAAGIHLSFVAVGRYVAQGHQMAESHSVNCLHVHQAPTGIKLEPFDLHA